MKSIYFPSYPRGSIFAFISCSSDDDDNGDYDKSMIVGTWEMTAVKTSESGTYVDWPFRKTYATFNADGSYYGSGYFGTGRGTWSLKGNTLNTYVEGELFTPVRDKNSS